MKVAGVTNIGLHRKRNEDRYYIDTDRGFFVVCDGMGGHKGGDVASQLAVDTVQQNFFVNGNYDIVPVLRNAVELANKVVYYKGLSDESLHEMGTTLTAAAVICEKLTVAHIGDSSLFLYNKGGLRKITRDHTLAEQMLRDGLIKPEEVPTSVYNHVLTRALGVEKHVEVDIYQQDISRGDWILICSDGLTDLVTDSEIGDYLGSAREPQETSQALVKLALNRGGYDNITIVLLTIN